MEASFLDWAGWLAGVARCGPARAMVAISRPARCLCTVPRLRAEIAVMCRELPRRRRFALLERRRALLPDGRARFGLARLGSTRLAKLVLERAQPGEESGGSFLSPEVKQHGKVAVKP